MGAAVTFFRDQLGCTEAQAQAAEAKLPRHYVDLVSVQAAVNVREMLQQRLELTDAQAKKIFLTLPGLAVVPSSSLSPRLSFLQERLGLSDAQLRKMVVTLPTSIGITSETAESKLCCLEDRLQLDEAELTKLVSTAPGVFSRDIEGSVWPKLAKLQVRLGLSDEQLRAVLLRFPALLNYSYEAKMAPALLRLQQLLGLSDAQLRQVVCRQPFTPSLHTLPSHPPSSCVRSSAGSPPCSATRTTRT